jgi:pyrimidine operon attenuation protein / uracil phosphoribosyltransferase
MEFIEKSCVMPKADMNRVLARIAAWGRRTMRQSDDKLRCSFCGKSQSEIKKLIAGPSVYICNECVDICSELVADGHKKHSGGAKMEFIEKSCVMTRADMNRVLARIASQIVENNPDLTNVLLVGIRRRGVPLAERLAARIREMDSVAVATGALDITLYRDDLSTVGERPVVNKTELPANITGKTIILVDDVLYTGRTIRAAMDELIDFGRPRRVQLAVLVDRGWRELPIQADYIGKYVTTTEKEIIKVMLPEFDETEQVLLVEQK